MSVSYFPSEGQAPSNGTKSPLLSPGAITSPLSPGPSKVNALQARIATVLSASYADLEISETLQTLDKRGIENTAETRRNLRLDLQQELITSNGEVVKDFAKVADQLKRVGAALQHLNKTCETIRTHVHAARKETGPMLEEHRALADQRRQTTTKQKLLQAFNAHFILTDDELKALTSSAIPVDQTFYDSLMRAKQIHDDCQVLLGSENQTLGLQILEQSSRDLNAAYQKLFRWTQRELKTVDLENPQVSNAIRQALSVLAERPSLFQSCLDFFAESREEVLSDAFYAALTGTVPNTSATVAVPSNAIELNAHEPMRYVSDMLAWVHAAAVGEREALQSLFVSDAEISKSLRIGRKNQPWLQDGDDAAVDETAFDGKQALSELVDRDIRGVVRQLRQRIEQMIRSHEDATLAYQVANLASFYRTVFVPLLGSGSNLDASLEPIGDMAMDHFRTITRDHIVNLHGETDAAPDDLAAPDFLEEALESLRKLMKSYDASFASAVSADEKNKGFELVLVEALDPYLSGCENIARRMDRPDSEIFALNCLLYTRIIIKGPSYTASRVESIDQLVQQQKERLTESIHHWLVTESGLEELLAAVEPYTTEINAGKFGSIRDLEVMKPDSLVESAGQLDAFLPTSMEDARSFVGRLRDRTLARTVCELAADQFVEEFEGLESVLVALDEITEANADTAGDGGDGEVFYLREAFPRTSDEIKVLLS